MLSVVFFLNPLFFGICSSRGERVTNGAAERRAPALATPGLPRPPRPTHPHHRKGGGRALLSDYANDKTKSNASGNPGVAMAGAR